MVGIKTEDWNFLCQSREGSAHGGEAPHHTGKHRHDTGEGMVGEYLVASNEAPASWPGQMTS